MRSPTPWWSHFVCRSGQRGELCRYPRRERQRGEGRRLRGGELGSKVELWVREEKKGVYPVSWRLCRERCVQEDQTGEAFRRGRSLNDASSSSPVRNFSTPGSFTRGHIDVGATTPARNRETSHNLPVCFTAALKAYSYTKICVLI
jgi:hypothetical protein